MAFALPDLPYSKDALGEFMSAETLDYHHGKHHKAYVDKVNGWIDEKGLAGASLTEVIKRAKDAGDKGLFNNAAQVWNHSFFWQCLAPPQGQKPTGRLAEMIESAFGGTDAMLQKLQAEAVGHFASGWAWLVLDGGKLAITSTPNQNSPLTDGKTPLLGNDVWEHAYYLKYQNKRPDYLKATWNVVNWDKIAERYAAAK